MGPSTSLATLRPDLRAGFEQFDMEANRRGFIGLLVLPVFETDMAADTYGVLTLEELLKGGDTARAPGADYNEGSFKFQTALWATQEHGWKEAIDDNQARKYKNFFNAEQVHAARALNIVLSDLEKRIAALIFNTTTWNGAALTTAIGIPWSTPATAVPITDIAAAKQKVWDGTGMWPNTLVLTKKAFDFLVNVVQIIERVKYSGHTNPNPGDITPQAMAQALNIDRLVISNSAKNSAAEGQSRTIASIWNDTQAMVCHVAEGEDLQQPVLGRVFHWGEDGSSIGGTIETYRDENRRSDIVRVRMETDERVTYKEMGHLLTAVTA